MTIAILIQSAAMLYVVQVRSSGSVGARSSLYRGEALTSSFIAPSRAASLTAMSLNPSCAKLAPFSRQLVSFLFRWRLLRVRRPVDSLERKPVQSLYRQLQILLRRVLFSGVAEALEALYEEHHRRHRPRHLRRVVQRAARQPVRSTSHLVHGFFGKSDKLLVKRYRLYLPEPLPLDRHIFLPRYPLARLLRRLQHVGEHAGVQGALVQRHLAPPVERSDDARSNVHGTDSAAHVVPSRRVVPKLDGRAGRRDKGVPAHVHRRRAGVGVLPRKAHCVPLDPERPEHHSQRQVHALQHRTLLDVQLQVSDGVSELLVRLVHSVELDPVLGQRIRQRDSVFVFEVANVIGLQRPGRRPRAEEATTEEGALFVGPIHESERDRALLRRERAEDFKSADRVQGAVEPAAVWDGVYVAAEDDGLFSITRGGRPEVAG